MDNTGGLSSVPGGSGEILKPQDNAPTGEVLNFGDFIKSEKPQESVEETPVNPENDAAVGEMAGDMQSSAMPVAPTPVMKNEEGSVSQEVEDLQKINIERDAEQLPKEYVAAVAKIIESDKKDPYQLVTDLDKARWDLLKKAYGRNKGDGLSGRGA